MNHTYEDSKLISIGIGVACVLALLLMWGTHMESRGYDRATLHHRQLAVVAEHGQWVIGSAGTIEFKWKEIPKNTSLMSGYAIRYTPDN